MTKIMQEIINQCKIQGISQAELARRTQISEKSISCYFNDIHTPNLEYVEDMVKAINCILIIS